MSQQSSSAEPAQAGKDNHTEVSLAEKYQQANAAIHKRTLALQAAGVSPDDLLVRTFMHVATHAPPEADVNLLIWSGCTHEFLKWIQEDPELAQALRTAIESGRYEDVMTNDIYHHPLL